MGQETAIRKADAVESQGNTYCHLESVSSAVDEISEEQSVDDSHNSLRNIVFI